MTYLCEDSRSSERTSRENVESCGCGADESGEHCGLWEKKWGKRGGEGMSRCRIYICKVRTRNGNQTPSVGNQPRINKSQAPHILPVLSLWRQRPPPGDVISNRHHHALNMGYYLRTTTVLYTYIYIYASLYNTSKHMFPDNTTIIDPVGPPYTPPETPADPQRCKLLGTTGLVVQALSKSHTRLSAFFLFFFIFIFAQLTRGGMIHQWAFLSLLPWSLKSNLKRGNVHGVFGSSTSANSSSDRQSSMLST